MAGHCLGSNPRRALGARVTGIFFFVCVCSLYHNYFYLFIKFISSITFYTAGAETRRGVPRMAVRTTAVCIHAGGPSPEVAVVQGATDGVGTGAGGRMGWLPR